VTKRRAARDEGSGRISVIVPARKAAATLGETLAGLTLQRFDHRFEVIVVDDGSDDDTARIAEDSDAVDRVVRIERCGPAQARNAGVAAASARRLAFLDADCQPTASWLSAGDRALETADLVLGETRPRPDRHLDPFARTLWVTGPSPLFESANLFVRRELFERLGGFESWLVPRRGKELGEDVLFGWRAARAGARIEFCGAALAHHEVHSRGALGYAGERWRLRFFPLLARRIPELRRAAFYRRYFLTPRAARFDAALAGILAAALLQRPLLAAAALPYARVVAGDVRGDGPRATPAKMLADAVGFAALAVGSARSRTLLL
jgi:glycosyltransferase involved in cell wall biosynthesis